MDETIIINHLAEQLGLPKELLIGEKQYSISSDILNKYFPIKNFVIVPQKEYKQLLHDQTFLNYLRVNGVDNWEGYDAVCQQVNEEYPYDEEN